MTVSSYLLLLAMVGSLAAQTFDAASVKTVPSGGRGGPITGGPGTPDPGRFSQQSTLRVLIAVAYGVQSDQVTGPDWINSSLYSVEARVPEGATREQFNQMYQKLLSERFRLEIHRETKQVEGYDLVVAKSGFKLKELPSDSNAPVRPRSGGSFGPDGAVLTYERVPFSFFTRDLNMRIAQAHGAGPTIVRVTDKTGITGLYSFTLRYTHPGDDASGDDLFAAIESQLGLKLVPAKATVEMIVIDHAEKIPTEN